MSSEKPFKLRVTLQPRDENRAVLRGVLCEVCLPTRTTGAVELRLSSSQFRRHGFPYEFSLRGQIRQHGHVQRTVEATRVYSNQASTTYWSEGLKEDVVIGEPMDLTTTDWLGGAGRSGRKAPVHVAFWLTDNIHLRPQKSLMTSYTGRVTVRVHRRQRVTVGSVRLTFDNYSRYVQSEDKSWVTFQEPVAVGSVRRLGDIPELVARLDDVLVLAGLAARRRTVCVGWEAVGSSVLVKHYHRGLSIPTEKRDHSFNEVLIGQKEFARFLRQAYRVFRAAPEPDLLQKAIRAIIPDGGNNLLVPGSFLRLFHAVESLTLRYRRMNDMENVVPKARFKRVAKAIKQAIGTDLVAADRISFLVEKIPELNHVSFSAAVRAGSPWATSP